MHLLVCYLNELQNARYNDKDSLHCYILILFDYILYYSLQSYICGHIYRDFIITTHYYVVFYHLTIHNFS